MRRKVEPISSRRLAGGFKRHLMWARELFNTLSASSASATSIFSPLPCFELDKSRHYLPEQIIKRKEKGQIKCNFMREYN